MKEKKISKTEFGEESEEFRDVTKHAYLSIMDILDQLPENEEEFNIASNALLMALVTLALRHLDEGSYQGWSTNVGEILYDNIVEQLKRK